MGEQLNLNNVLLVMVRAVLGRHEVRGFVDSDGRPTPGNVELQIDRSIVARYLSRQAVEWAVISNSTEKQKFCAATLSTQTLWEHSMTRR
ncbi:uncharacterized protein N7459_001842 [Penicillium hispanicum]|uniref:uncharacterized protein n=1 Tax=Penicillium hispanicum TaxID=1080232 RepID=UPI0025421BD7|nr:uncharacterized protein N7459_001842 [Penicillium hispanicum]KAJ5591473.1 hypothetical protein N7459_001842 [Penicillium hispanicum]